MKQHSWTPKDENRNPDSRYYHAWDVVDFEGEPRPEVFIAVPRIDISTPEGRLDNLAAVTGIVEFQIGCEVENFVLEEV